MTVFQKHIADAWIRTGRGTTACEEACKAVGRPVPRHPDATASRIIHKPHVRAYIREQIRAPDWWEHRREEIRASPETMKKILMKCINDELKNSDGTWKQNYDKRLIRDLVATLNVVNLSEAKIQGMLIERHEVVGQIDYMLLMAQLTSGEARSVPRALPKGSSPPVIDISGNGKPNGTNGHQPPPNGTDWKSIDEG